MLIKHLVPDKEQVLYSHLLFCIIDFIIILFSQFYF